MGNVSTEMEILRKEPKRNVTGKHMLHVWRMLSDRHVLGTTEETISELEDISIESSKIEKQKEKRLKKKTKKPEHLNCGTKKGVT